MTFFVLNQLFRACLSPDTMGDGTGCDNMTAIIVRIGGMADNGSKLNESEKLETGNKRPLDSPVSEVSESKRVRVEAESTEMDSK